MSARGSAPGSHRPRLALAPRSPRRVPIVACRVHATRVGSVKVHVVPRSERTVVETSSGRIVIRVRAIPDEGRATEEARKALADALRVAPSGVALRRGRRSREKVFEVAELTEEEALQRLRQSGGTHHPLGLGDASTCYPSPP